MPVFLHIALICCVLASTFSPTNVRAGCPMWDAEAFVTVRDGLPCFSYPQDEVIRMRPFSFGYLSVSKRGPIGEGGWEAQITDP